MTIATPRDGALKSAADAARDGSTALSQAEHLIAGLDVDDAVADLVHDTGGIAAGDGREGDRHHLVQIAVR